jgi:UTP--glucose-1-phosphate uridylyltransferase
MKAVIPAAGLGIRFLPATKAQPKEMLPIVDKPCIQYVIEEAVAAGITDIVIITGRGKRSIEDHFDRSIELEERLIGSGQKESAEKIRRLAELADIFFIRQKEPLGLGHAILCAKKHIGNEPFAVMLGDDLIISEKSAIGQLMETFEKFGRKSVVGIESVDPMNVSRYGIISPGKKIDDMTYHIVDMIEKPEREHAPSNLAIIGRYIFTSDIFRYLEITGKGYGGEIQLTDAMRLLAKDQEMYGRIIEGRRFDIGSKADWIRANIAISLERNDLRNELIPWLRKIISNNKFEK